MAISLQERLNNYIGALELLVKTGDPEPNIIVALGCIVVSLNLCGIVETLIRPLKTKRECLMLVMSSFARGPRVPIPLFLLSAAAEMDVAIKEGRAMDVNAISKHDVRVHKHPWYSQGHSPSSQRAQYRQCDMTATPSSPGPNDNPHSLPPCFGRTRSQRKRADGQADVVTATLPLTDTTDCDL